MDRAAAFTVLGLSDGAAWPAVRAAYLRLVREHHPDAAADLAETGIRTVRTAQITEAYAVLVPPEQPASDPLVSNPAPRARVAWRFDDVLDGSRRVLLDAEIADAFVALVEVAHIVGTVSYVDRESAVLEAIVTPVPTEATSLLVYLEPGDEPGVTEAVFGVEPLGSHPPVPVDVLVDRVAVLLAAPRGPTGSDPTGAAYSPPPPAPPSQP